MPVNPYITFPVWQQAVTHSFTFVYKEADLGKSLGRYEPFGVLLASLPWLAEFPSLCPETSVNPFSALRQIRKEGVSQCNPSEVRLRHVEGTALIYTSWGSGSYAQGHELKAVATKHFFVSERHGEYIELVSTAPQQTCCLSTLQNGALISDGLKEHVQGLWEDGTSEQQTERYPSVEKGPAIAPPEQIFYPDRG